jgi:hypothetical protein
MPDDFDPNAELDRLLAAPPAAPAASPAPPPATLGAASLPLPPNSFDANTELDRLLGASSAPRRPYDPNDYFGSRPWQPGDRSIGDIARTALEATGRGAIEGITETMRAPGTLIDGTTQPPPPPPAPDDHTGQVLRTTFGEGWNNPEWYAAQVGHMLGHGAPTFAAGLAGGAIGGAVGGPIGAGIGGAGGFALGSMLQEFVPAFERAREAGLGVEEARDRALIESGIAGAFGAVMGGVGPAMNYLRPLVSRAIIASGLVSLGTAGRISRGIGTLGKAPAQLGVVQPTLAIGQQVAEGAAEGRIPTREELVQTAVLGLAQGLPTHLTSTGAQRVARAVRPERVGSTFDPHAELDRLTQPPHPISGARRSATGRRARAAGRGADDAGAGAAIGHRRPAASARAARGRAQRQTARERG